MKTNREILNEKFFKKSSFSDNLDSMMAKYTPVDAKTGGVGFGSPMSAGYAVTDTDEVKRRLAGAFGAAFGTNNVRSMASRAVKTFPILISDNIEPETSLMLKRLMEEQYAEYINLLVSNQVIDLSAYSTDADGNVAIQVLDNISGVDDSKARIFNKMAKTGSIGADDLFGNIPLYNLLRQESAEFKTDDELVNILFENALVIDPDAVNDVVSYLLENSDGDPTKNPTDEDKKANSDEKKAKKNYNERKTTLNDFLNNTFNNDITNRVENYDKVHDAMRGFMGIDKSGKEIYTKLSNTEILMDPKMLNSSLNRSVGEMLADPKNEAIRDKFEKATFLLQSGLIAGREFISYVSVRLGLPISSEVRINLIKRFPTASTLQFDGFSGLTDPMRKNIEKNQKIIKSSIKSVLNIKVKDVLGAAGVGAIAGAAGAGAGIATSVATSGAVGIGATVGAAPNLGALATFLFVSNPFIGWALLPAAIGVGAGIISRMIKKNRDKNTLGGRIEGWERVESLIDKLDFNRNEINNKHSKNFNIGRETIDKTANKLKYNNTNDPIRIDGNDDKDAKIAELKQELEKLTKGLKAIGLSESTEYSGKIYVDTSTPSIKESLDFALEAYNEFMADKDAYADALCEDIVSPVKLKTTYVEKKPGKDILYTPAFATRAPFAYGSTEIDRRVAKERKFNQPLVMTVRFKERYDDGRFSDNELVAVIGILGQLIRIPSEEMQYVLQSNAEGETISGIFSSGKINNTITDLISGSKIAKDMKALPKSSQIWKNLEKVGHLAIANKLAGKKSDNVANAHLVFSQKEVDDLRTETGIDYLKDAKLTSKLMSRYSAFTVMIANDPSQRVYIMDDPENISWNVVPYSALMSKDSGDQLTAALTKLSQGRI